MSQTLDALQSILDRLTAQHRDLAVEYWPMSWKQYRLNHPNGALLLGYVGGVFGEAEDLDLVAQRRGVRPVVTAVMRQLYGRTGIIERLDLVRLGLVGFAPAHCNKLRAVDERFLAEESGIWFYATTFEAMTMQVEDAALADGAKATTFNFE